MSPLANAGGLLFLLEFVAVDLVERAAVTVAFFYKVL